MYILQMDFVFFSDTPHIFRLTLLPYDIYIHFMFSISSAFKIDLNAPEYLHSQVLWLYVHAYVLLYSPVRY